MLGEKVGRKISVWIVVLASGFDLESPGSEGEKVVVGSVCVCVA